jgi:AcrR family transcriptional regulator
VTVNESGQPHSRRYDNSKRRDAAVRTQRQIVEAARELFLGQGYAATTMSQIAESAGVALDTVYASVGPKATLFRQLLELAISGGDEPVDAEQRDYVREIREEPDARRKLDRYARAAAEIHARLGPLVRTLREASRQEPDLAGLWVEISNRRAKNMRLFVEEVASAGTLRNGMSIDRAADIVWATHSPEFYLLLVEERGWTPEQWRSWIAESIARLILDDEGTSSTV